MAARDEVTAAYSQSVTRTRSRLVRLLARLWRALTSYDDDAAGEFVPVAVSLVAGAQQVVAELTEEYTRATLSGYGVDVDRIPRVEPEQVSGAAARNGADPQVVYRRPFTEARWRLSRGEDVADAAEAGETRLVILAETDVQLAKTRTAHRILNDPEVKRAGVRFYRRVLTGDSSCGLCVVAATQRYRVEQMQPVHPGCDCDVEALPPGDHPQVIDPDLLKAAHTAIAERFGPEAVDYSAGQLYRDHLLVQEHGELGPVLTVAGHRFTGPERASERESR